MLYAPTSDRAMKFVEPSPFADPDIAARKLVELANGIEAAQDGRIYTDGYGGMKVTETGSRAYQLARRPE